MSVLGYSADSEGKAEEEDDEEEEEEGAADEADGDDDERSAFSSLESEDAGDGLDGLGARFFSAGDAEEVDAAAAALDASDMTATEKTLSH